MITVFTLTACRSGPPPIPPTPTIAALPTARTLETVPDVASLVTCAQIDANWGQDWAAVLDTLDRLIETGQSCGEEPLPSKKYAVHFNYAAALEAQGEIEAAVAQYRAALTLDPRRREALGALIRLEALPKPTPLTCTSASPPLPDPPPAAEAAPARLVQVKEGQLRLAGQPFTIRGVNYYPRQAPWERFWTEADPVAMAEELDAIRAGGLNTLRIFLWYQPLFTCQPEDAIPNEAAFELVDTIFRLAEARDLKLIVSLNDLPDLIYRPLYTDWSHYDAQTAYIVRRYRHEPSLLAWDVRNAPDFDLQETPGRFTEADVTGWLAHIAGLIRRHDPHHLITAAMDGDPTAIEPYVDILGFQHWGSAGELAGRLADYKQNGSKPLLLMSAGEHSWPGSPDSPQDETSQARYLKQLVNVAELAKAGWLIWTAFDFVPAPGQPDNHNFYFGLWRTDLSPKPVLETLPLKP